MYKKCLSFILTTVLLLTASISVTAAPTDAYAHIESPSGQFELQYTREMYSANKFITASSLGLEKAFNGLTDIYVAENGKIIVLCGGDSRIVELNSDYTFSREILITDEKGEEVSFSEAQGIYMDKKGEIYLADTSNARVIIADNSGKLIRFLPLPESDYIDDDFLYQPAKIAKDSDGYLYVLSNGSFYGALLYDPEYNFMGFYGSNSVEATALDTLQFLWDKLTSNDIKKSKSSKLLPYSFVDFDFDSYDYLVTCTGKTGNQGNGKGQIRKISHNGSNILYKKTPREGYVLSSTVNFLEEQLILFEDVVGTKIPQNLIAIAVGENDFIYSLDAVHGLIYIYDSECNCMNIFGGGIGLGDQLGSFKKPIALDINGDQLLVADEGTLGITVFELNDYGKLFIEAQGMYIKGDYADAKPLFEQIINLDSSNQLAYRALGSAYYYEGNYEKAMELCQKGLDYNTYDLAKQALIKKHIAKYFIWYLFAIIAILIGIFFIIKYKKKHKIIFIKNKKLKLVIRLPFHPFDAYTELKYKSMGSVKVAIAITVIFYVVSFIRDTLSGFLYTSIDISSYNSIYTIGKTIGLVVLWSICYWLVISMTTGNGTFSEIFTSTAYALVPMVVYTLFCAILSNVLPYSVAGLMGSIEIVIWMFTFFLLAIGMMIVNEYDFFKFIGTALVAVLFMILVVFILFMCALMLKQAGSFVISVVTEILYR